MTPHATPAQVAQLEEANLRQDVPDFRVGDTVNVHYKIVEGDKLRGQVFKGIVLKSRGQIDLAKDDLSRALKGALEQAGVRVWTYEGAEISRKGDGGPTCLTRALERD